MRTRVIGRRSLLRAGASGLAVAVVPGGCFFGSGRGTGPATDGGSDGIAPDAASVDDARALDAADASTCAPGSCTLDGNTLVLTFAEYPQLAQVGGSVLVEDSRYHDPVCGQDFVMVAHPAAASFIALQGSCTHSCCAINFTGSSFFCPCHATTFDLDGGVVSGPAPLALQRLAVCATSCGVFVQLA